MKKFKLCNWEVGMDGFTGNDEFTLTKISGDCEESTHIMSGTEEEIIDYINNLNVIYDIFMFDKEGDETDNWEDSRNIEIVSSEEDENGNISYILEFGNLLTTSN